MTPRLSAVVITRNESVRIDDCLRSARLIADEIVVVDSGSSDDTVVRARKLADKVLARPFDDYASQKNFAVAQASGDWILSLDADERVTPALAAEIRAVIERGGALADVYRIRRRSKIFGRVFRFTGTQDDRPARLFRRGCARFEGIIHETLRTEGATADLRRVLTHDTYADTKDYMTRLNRYTSMEAERFVAERRTPVRGGLCLRPPAMFLKLYLYKLGFLDGLEGFTFSYLSAYYVFLKHAKHRWLLAGKGRDGS